MTTSYDPIWNLERRESSGQLIWRKESANSKVRFRFDVDVLEFEKQPHEDDFYELTDHDGYFFSNSSSMTTSLCVAVIAVTFFLPWYLMAKTTGV